MPAVVLLGGASILVDGRAVAGRAAQRHRLALLALLALACPRAVSRDRLLAYLWPERDTEPARNLLKQAVHALRNRKLSVEVPTKLLRKGVNVLGIVNVASKLRKTEGLHYIPWAHLNVLDVRLSGASGSRKNGAGVQVWSADVNTRLFNFDSAPPGAKPLPGATAVRRRIRIFAT